jgi:Methyl-accepting chemotaxis protein
MIHRQAKAGSRILNALIVCAIVASAFVMFEIRFGGPIERKHALNDEMLADILPPPAFVVEPYLEASLAAADASKGPHSLKRIAEIRGEFLQRKEYWEQANVPAEMRPQLERTIAVADDFFSAVETYLVPAINTRDRERINDVLQTRLTPLYERQHQEVTKLVALSRNFDQRETARDDRTVLICLVFSGVLAMAVIAAIQLSSSFIRKRVVEPLADTSEKIENLASGNFDVAIEGADRTDEFGAMARAVQVFRDAGIAREKARAEQQQVVDALSTGLQKLADKDFTFRITDPLAEVYDGLRADFNAATGSIAMAMSNVRGSTDNVFNSISEIRAATDDLASRNQQQAASLEETAAAMRQVSGRISEAAGSTGTARDAISQARQHASEGGEVVQDAVAAMATIEASAREISSVVEVIDGIAFQTNLLALNAGVEAARAGDAGKGFAVVASEVRALAQRSADAAQNIRELIARSSAQVGCGVELVGQTGSKLQEILEKVSTVHTLIATISDSAREQAGDLNIVGNAVSDMDRTTQQNAAMVEQTSAATRSLESEAVALSQMMATFRTDDGPAGVHMSASGNKRRGVKAANAREYAELAA